MSPSTESGSLIDESVREAARRMPAAAVETEVDQYMAELAAQRDDAGRRLLSATAGTCRGP